MSRRVTGFAVAALSLLALSCTRPPQGQTPSGQPAPVNPQVVAARGTLAESEQATIAIFKSASPSVVQVVAGSPSNGFNGAQIATGTGFVWDRDGHIVTNYHVVAQSSQVVVRPPNGGDDIPATVIGSAPN